MRKTAGLLLALWLSTLVAGCGDPCERLAEKICERVEDRRACTRSRADMKDFTPEICEHALSIFERLYED